MLMTQGETDHTERKKQRPAALFLYAYRVEACLYRKSWNNRTYI